MCIVHLHLLHNKLYYYNYMISCVSASVCVAGSHGRSVDPARVTMQIKSHNYDPNVTRGHGYHITKSEAEQPKLARQKAW